VGWEKLREWGLLKPKIEIKDLSCQLFTLVADPRTATVIFMGPPLDTRKLQFIDRWIGTFVCGALTLVRRLSGSPGGGNIARRPTRILFVKFAEQGSTVLAYHAISRAVEMVGCENVYFLVFQENRFILDVMHLIPEQNVVTVGHKNILDAGFQALHALQRIRKIGIDAAIDLEFFSRSSAALTFLSGAGSRVGFHTFFGEGPYRGDLMTHRLLYNPYIHTSQNFQLMVEALGQVPDNLPTFGGRIPASDAVSPQFTVSPVVRQEVQAIVQREGGRSDEPPLILLNPNASDLLPLRKWPTDRYVELAQRLLERFTDVSVGMTGAPDEAEAIGRLAAEVGSPRCFSLAGKTTLAQLLVLYALSELLITNDSGPAHFASMTPITVITLFGPETPSLFRALTPRAIPIWMQLPCSPCVNAYNNRQSPCRDNICMKSITVDHVFSIACEAYLERQKEKESSKFAGERS
jgi:ADP-heptose:LPS heptosyltransferase